MSPTTFEVTPASPPMDAPHILLIDDDRRIRELLGRYLGEHGHRITMARSIEEAREKLTVLTFDLLILDIMLPGENGLDFAKTLRAQDQAPLRHVPILMLTAKGDAQERIAGLEAGVDDYLSKPFEPRELLLRITSILRRARPEHDPAPQSPPARVTFGPFCFDLGKKLLTRDNEPVRLTEREAEILTLLANTRGTPLPREALAGAGQTDGAALAMNERSIDVQINRLRRKIETAPTNPLHLQTVRGAGYRLVIDG